MSQPSVALLSASGHPVVLLYPDGNQSDPVRLSPAHARDLARRLVEAADACQGVPKFIEEESTTKTEVDE